MITILGETKNNLGSALRILKEFHNDDFYLTENNQRVFIDDLRKLKKLFRQSNDKFWEDTLENRGIILVWKSLGGETERRYVKIIADSPTTAERLLTVLLWNTKKDLYIKIKKDSPYLNTFKSKGFKFIGGRGSQILLKRQFFNFRTRPSENNNDRNYSKNKKYFKRERKDSSRHFQSREHIS